MYKPSKAIFILLTLALSLSACVPAAQPAAQQAQNTPDLLAVQDQINTSVAATIEAQNQIGTFVAQTVEAQAAPTFTATPFTIPTFTPFVIATVTPVPRSSGGSGGSGSSGYSGNGSGGPGSPKYDCALVNQKPHDGAYIYRPGDSFDVVWTLKNTGTATIPAGYPFQYIGGTDMSPTKGVITYADFAPGDTFTFRIEVIAPQVQGVEKEQFTMQWALIVKGNKICKPYISIFVQKH